MQRVGVLNYSIAGKGILHELECGGLIVAYHRLFLKKKNKTSLILLASPIQLLIQNNFDSKFGCNRQTGFLLYYLSSNVVLNTNI